jgi:hypothetical protein
MDVPVQGGPCRFPSRLGLKGGLTTVMLVHKKTTVMLSLDPHVLCDKKAAKQEELSKHPALKEYLNQA